MGSNIPSMKIALDITEKLLSPAHSGVEESYFN